VAKNESIKQKKWLLCYLWPLLRADDTVCRVFWLISMQSCLVFRSHRLLQIQIDVTRDLLQLLLLFIWECKNERLFKKFTFMKVMVTVEVASFHGPSCMYLQVFHFHIKAKPLLLKLFSSLFLLVLRLYGFFLVCTTNYFKNNCISWFTCFAKYKFLLVY